MSAINFHSSATMIKFQKKGFETNSTAPSFVRMFKPQFAPMVEAGTKLQTVRPTPKRMPKVGDKISLRCWTDKPYRSKQRVLIESTITEVSIVDITEDGIAVNSYAEPCDDFARADGFRNFFELRDWFRATHGLPFEGIVIHWASINQGESHE
jgi:hypothetical protein